MLEKILESKRNEVAGGLRKLQNEELNNLYRSDFIKIDGVVI
jgi:hypothetical protein